MISGLFLKPLTQSFCTKGDRKIGSNRYEQHLKTMFLHQHPYEPFVPKGSTKLIVGTIPPPRFSIGKLFKEDVDFCYGSKYGLLWPLLDRIFQLNLSYENTCAAIEQRKFFLKKNKIGICDMVDHCRRDKIDASDLGMKHIQLRNLISVLKKNESVNTVLFMGGNSKNGPENLFRKHLKNSDLKLHLVSKHSPRHGRLNLESRSVDTYSLISPSSAANRSIGGNAHYKHQKSLNPEYSTLDFRVAQYKNYFV